MINPFARLRQYTSDRFEMDYILAAVPKPYVAVMDGITSMSDCVT